MSATLEVTTVTHTLEVTVDGTAHTLTVEQPASVAILEVNESGGAVSSVNGQTGAVVLDKSDVGLGNADNTTDLAKPISTAAQTALNLKEDSANKATDFSTVNHTKFPTVSAAKTYADSVGTAATANAITTLRNGVATAGDDLAKLYALIQAINTIIGGTSPDGDSVTNTVAEILAVMATYPEGVDVLTTLNAKINTSAIINNLLETASGKVLDARQGKALKDLIDALTSTVSGKENSITAGTTSQYWRGDKTFQTLDKSAVGLGNVSNSDTTTTANISDSADKRFVTDAEKTSIGTIAAKLPSASILRAYQSADASYINDDTLNDTELSVGVQAGGVYEIHSVLHVDTSGGAGGIQIGFGGTATATNFLADMFARSFSDLAAASIAERRTSLSHTLVAAGSDLLLIEINGSIEVNASGTFIITAAQNVADAGASILLRGNSLVLTRLN